MMPRSRRMLLEDAALRRVRKANGMGTCRICHGNTWEQRPYCRRHFHLLYGYNDLMAASSEETLTEADAFIRLKEATGQNGGVNGIGSAFSIRDSETASRPRWVIRFMDREIARVASKREAYRWLLDYHAQWSLHNRYASKRLIR